MKERIENESNGFRLDLNDLGWANIVVGVIGVVIAALTLYHSVSSQNKTEDTPYETQWTDPAPVEITKGGLDRSE